MYFDIISSLNYIAIWYELGISWFGGIDMRFLKHASVLLWQKGIIVVFDFFCVSLLACMFAVLR